MYSRCRNLPNAMYHIGDGDMPCKTGEDINLTRILSTQLNT